VGSKREYNEEESKRTEQAYLSPEIERQRERTLEVIDPQHGDTIVDIGCGPGLLAHEMAAAVSNAGRIVGVDSSSPMLELARNRCAQFSNVEFVECKATDLAVDDASADVVTCIQVLLYVADVEKALQEMHRVLKPGGRAIIMETDWRSTVLHSHDEVLTEKIIEAWDKAVPSPRLPARLFTLLRRTGFTSAQVEAIPIQSTDCTPDGFSMAMMAQSAEAACEQGIITQSQSQAWLEDLTQLGAKNAYFFCVNRFLFSAIRL
jgi:ubiquinone/menaquinone biosynthesis C-methylase UbiE